MTYVWVFVLFVRIASSAGITQVGPFENQDLCEEARMDMVGQFDHISGHDRVVTSSCFEIAKN